MAAYEISRPAPLSRALAVQARVIGALIIRELHTRFGRDNIGVLWLLVEPMLLAVGVVLMHVGSNTVLPGGFPFVPFYITGYVSYMLFRSNIGRATATIEPNKGLLFHRQVTLLDLVLSRTILEFFATTTTLLIMLYGAAILGLADPPGRPLILFAGMGLMWWFTTGMAMMICAASEFSSTVERLVHPFTYLSIPVSGMLMLIDWVPPFARDYVKWIPLPQIVDMVREGVFAQFDSAYVNVPYICAWSAAFSFLGLMALKVARPRLHIA